MENKRLTQLIAFLKDEPNDPFLKYAIAQEYLAMEKWNDAKTWFTKVLTQHPDYVATYYHLGKLLYMLGKEQESILILETGIKKAAVAGDSKTQREIEELLEDIE